MGVRGQKIRPDAAQDRYAAEGGEGANLHPREVLETLETSSYVDDDVDAARGFVNAAVIGAVVWTLTIVTYLLLT
ncbi:MAG TPA: hypothetical protein VMR74_07915 [Gammaproteobacteria bacterium]|nr:hypothetical protein [Gammaproteobacteria bacterium]